MNIFRNHFLGSIGVGILFLLITLGFSVSPSAEAACQNDPAYKLLECSDSKDENYDPNYTGGYSHVHIFNKPADKEAFRDQSKIISIEVNYLNSSPQISYIGLVSCPGSGSEGEITSQCTVLAKQTGNSLSYSGPTWGLSSGNNTWKSSDGRFIAAVVAYKNYASKAEVERAGIVESRAEMHYINGAHDIARSTIKTRFTPGVCTGDNCIPDKPDCTLTPNAPECRTLIDCTKTPNDPACKNPCPDGQARRADGTCPNPNPNPCPNGQPRNADGTCPSSNTCPDGRPRNPDGTCSSTNPCPNGQPRNADGTCPNTNTCPDGQPRRPDGTCPSTNPCPNGQPRRPDGTCPGGTTPNCSTNPNLPGCGGGGSNRYCGDGQVNPQDGEQCDFYRSNYEWQTYYCNGINCTTPRIVPTINNPTPAPAHPPVRNGCDGYCKIVPNTGTEGGGDGCSGNDCVCITYTINQDQKVRGNNQEATYTVTVENKSKDVHVGPIDIAHEMWRNNDKPDGKQGYVAFKDLSGLVSALRKIGNFPAPVGKAGGRIELDKLDPGQKYTFTFKGQAKAFQSGYELKTGVQQADVTSVIRAYTSQKTGEVKEVDRDYATMVVSRSVVLTRNSGNVFANSRLGYIADIQETIVKYTGNATGFHNFTGVILGEIGMAGDTLVSAYIYRGNAKESTGTGTGRDEYFIRIINEIPKITRNIRGGSGTQANSNADLEKLGTRPDNAKIFVAQNGLTIGGTLAEDTKANLVPTMQIEGRKTIIIENGDLTINQNIAYKAIPADVVSKDAIPSIAFIVKSGNIYIHPSVTSLSGLYMVGEQGKILSTQNLATSNVVPKPLTIEGMVIGNVEELLKARAYIGDVVRDSNNKVVTLKDEGSVVIKHDARIYSYPPPGISDILRGGVQKDAK